MKDANKIATITAWLGSGSINIFGRPFAGKDTHGRELAAIFGASLLSGGDILRNSVIPEHVKKDLHNGILVPKEDYINIVLPFLLKAEFMGQPLILSSVGRWHGEEEGVMSVTAESGHPLKAVIYLDIDEDTVRERWATTRHLTDRGDRHDDTAEILEIRLKEYREKTLDVIDYYKELGILISIDSRLEKSAVLDVIIDELYKIAVTY